MMVSKNNMYVRRLSEKILTRKKPTEPKDLDKTLIRRKQPYYYEDKRELKIST